MFNNASQQQVVLYYNYQDSMSDLCVIEIVVVFLFYVHGKHLRSRRDCQLTQPHFSWAGLELAVNQ